MFWFHNRRDDVAVEKPVTKKNMYITFFRFSDKLIRVFQVFEENNSLEEKTFSPIEGHTYAINHVEFSKNGGMLASCSLDGCTTIWNSTVNGIF